MTALHHDRIVGGRGLGAVSVAVLGMVLLPLVVGAPAAAASAALDDAPTKEEARAEIQALIDASEWRKAKKAIKSYRKRHAETDEEEAECDRLDGFVEGSEDLAKIETSYRKKGHPRKTARSLGKFIEEYREHDTLAERASELLEAARSEYVMVIEDFETWKDEAEEAGVEVAARAYGRMSLVEDPKFAKHGKFAGRWSPGRAWVDWSVACKETDWSKYDYFCVWIYNAKVDARPGQMEIEAHSGGSHYFQMLLTIDWTGWREIRMPLRGRASHFGKHGNAEWDLIERLEFEHDDDTATSVEIIVDDIRLEKESK